MAAGTYDMGTAKYCSSLQTTEAAEAKIMKVKVGKCSQLTRPLRPADKVVAAAELRTLLEEHWK